MKTQLAQLTVWLQKVDRRAVQMIITMAALALMVLGVGAPDDALPFGR